MIYSYTGLDYTNYWSQASIPAPVPTPSLEAMLAAAHQAGPHLTFTVTFPGQPIDGTYSYGGFGLRVISGDYDVNFPNDFIPFSFITIVNGAISDWNLNFLNTGISCAPHFISGQYCRIQSTPSGDLLNSYTGYLGHRWGADVTGSGTWIAEVPLSVAGSGFIGLIAIMALAVLTNGRKHHASK